MPYEEINSNGESQLLRTENFVPYHQDFDSFLCGEGMAALLKQLSGDVSACFSNFGGSERCCLKV